MKKIVSLSLAAIMLLSMVPTAFAADYTAGTKVEYTAADQTAYTITVPAQLAPGATGEVKLEGTWASDATVKVTADASVTLTNSINAEDKHTLDITFPGIEKAGDNTQSRTYTANVTVAEMPENALFGTWSGKFNYNVEYVEVAHWAVEEVSTGRAYAVSVDETTGLVTLTKDLMIQNSYVSDNVYVTLNGEEVPLTSLGDGDYSFTATEAGKYMICGYVQTTGMSDPGFPLYNPGAEYSNDTYFVLSK